jgi:hypothetical protein
VADEAAQSSVLPEGSDPESAAVYLEAARHRLDAQVSASDVLDNRVAATFGVGSTVLPLTIGLLNQRTAALDAWVKSLLAAAIVAYVVLLIYSLAAYFLRTVSHRPDMPTLQTYSLIYRSDVLRQWVADEYTRSIVVNDDVLILKGVRAKWGLRSLYAEGLLLSVAALITIL